MLLVVNSNTRKVMLGLGCTNMEIKCVEVCSSFSVVKSIAMIF